MLITNEILEEFNEYCYKIQIEYNRLEYTDRTSNYWTHEHMNKYRFGIVTGLLYDANSKINEMLKYQCDIEMLYSLVKLDFYRNESKNKKIFEDYGQLELYVQRSFTLSISDYIYDWVKSYNYLYFEPVKNKTKNEQLMFLLLQLSYKKYYDEKEHHIEIKQPNLVNIVNKNNYNLIDINDNAILIPEICNRIYIKNINKTIFCRVDNRFAKVLFDLKNNGYINKLALKGLNDYIFDGIVKTSPLCEQVERGLLFNWDIEKLPKITKLYNEESYSDNMWVQLLDNDMIFEEMLDDEFKQDNNIITNAIHVVFYKKDNDYFISHMDHEFIFYSVEEYEKRKKQYNQKGYKKNKTFKIDDSAIPMNYPCETYNNNGDQKIVPFLYYVLNLYFNNKQLVKEYFSIR